MSTDSFNKGFVITDLDEADKFLTALENPIEINPTKRDYDQENKKGIKLLEKRLKNYNKGLE